MKKVAIIDSGSGGVNVMARCKKLCPYCNYLLFLDEKNLPYGEKSEEELKKIAIDLVENIKNIFNPEIIIIGCNTLTSVAISSLRIMFPQIIFIGSEPALLPAVREFNIKDVLVLATDVTIKNCRMLKDWQDICFCPKNLPKIIDDNLFDRKNIELYLEDALQGKKAKAVVLGCTHFEGIKPELSKILNYPKFFDTSEGIAKRLLSFCDTSNNCQFQIMTSGNGRNIGKFYHYFMSLDY